MFSIIAEGAIKFSDAIDESQKAYDSLTADLAKPVAFGIADLTKQLDSIISKTHAAEKAHDSFLQSVSREGLKYAPDFYNSATGQVEKASSGDPQAQNIAAGKQREYDIITKIADQEVKLADIKADDDKVAQIEFDRQQKRNQLEAEFNDLKAKGDLGPTSASDFGRRAEAIDLAAKAETTKELEKQQKTADALAKSQQDVAYKNAEGLEKDRERAEKAQERTDTINEANRAEKEQLDSESRILDIQEQGLSKGAAKVKILQEQLDLLKKQEQAADTTNEAEAKSNEVRAKQQELNHAEYVEYNKDTATKGAEVIAAQKEAEFDKELERQKAEFERYPDRYNQKDIFGQPLSNFRAAPGNLPPEDNKNDPGKSAIEKIALDVHTLAENLRAA